MIDIDALCRAAIRRLHKRIDARWQIARGRKPETARRSVGQLYKRRRAA